MKEERRRRKKREEGGGGGGPIVELDSCVKRSFIGNPVRTFEQAVQQPLRGPPMRSDANFEVKPTHPQWREACLDCCCLARRGF